MIDWQAITSQYNVMHMTRYTLAEMLEYLYRGMGSTQKVADYLGVSTYALKRKMDLLNVPRAHRAFWPGSYAEKLRSIPDVRMARMSAKQIAAEIGCKHEYVYKYLGRDNRRWKRTYKGAKNDTV